MHGKPDITDVGFKPPHDTRLAVEALTLEALRKRASAEHFEKLQRADFYRLIGVIAGDTHPMVDFTTFAATAGDWLLVRPGQVFRYDFSRPWDGWLLVFQPDGLTASNPNRVAEDVDLLRRVEDLSSLHTLSHAAHDWMLRSVQQIQHDAAITAEVALRNELLRLQLAGILLRLSMWQSAKGLISAGPATVHAQFRRFRKLLNADFCRQHQVQHYARMLGMSDKTLSRVCLAASGLPAKALINQRLILEARRLLAHTRVAVQTIGRELGFEEPTNFVKFFRKEAQMTPLAFRQHVAGTSAGTPTRSTRDQSPEN